MINFPNILNLTKILSIAIMISVMNWSGIATSSGSASITAPNDVAEPVSCFLWLVFLCGFVVTASAPRRVIRTSVRASIRATRFIRRGLEQSFAKESLW